MPETFQTMRQSATKTMSASSRPFWESAVPRKTFLASPRMTASARSSSNASACGKKSAAEGSSPASRTRRFVLRRCVSSAAKACRSASLGSSRSSRRDGRAKQASPSQTRAASSRPAQTSQATRPQPGANSSVRSQASPLSCTSRISTASMTKAVTIFKKCCNIGNLR